jgi:hypothetical protein
MNCKFCALIRLSFLSRRFPQGTKENKEILQSNSRTSGQKKQKENAGMHKFSRNLGSYLKIVGARRMTGSKFGTEGPQTLGATAQNVFARAPYICSPPHLKRYLLQNAQTGAEVHPVSLLNGYRGSFRQGYSRWGVKLTAHLTQYRDF